METKIENWFQCSECGSDMGVKQVAGVGVFSVNSQCENCAHRHVERDADSDNWKSGIKFKQYLTGQRLRAPKASRKGHRLVKCPECNSDEVDFWVYSDKGGSKSGDTRGHVRLDCNDCKAVYENTVVCE